MKNFLILYITLFACVKLNAQVGIGINPPDQSAMLQVQDSTKGLLIPRMRDVNRVAITNPAEGLLVYQTNAEKGFWYFTAGQWKNLAAANNGGKHILYLTDNITNSEAIARIATDVGPNTQEVIITRCTNLTTVDLSMITHLSNIYITNNTSLTSVNFSNLQAVDGGISILNNRVFASFITTNIDRIGNAGTYGLQIINSRLSGLSMPLLTRLDGMLDVRNDSSLTSINLPLLQQLPLGGAAATVISNNPLLTGISLPALTKLGDLTINDNRKLSSINFSTLTSLGNLSVSLAPLLPALSLPVLRKGESIITASNNVLSSISLPLLDTLTVGFSLVNSPLVTAVSLPKLITSGYISITGCPAVTSLSAPLLLKLTSSVFSIQIDGCSNINAINLPIVSTMVGTISIQNNPAIVTLNFSGVSAIPKCSIINNASLASFLINGMTSFTGNNFTVSANILPSAQVNYLLNKLVTAVPIVRNSTIVLTQSIAAPPTGQGITDKATLIARPNTVSTN